MFQCFISKVEYSTTPRKARIDAPGALHHIICRGIERRRIYRDDSDRQDFLNRLGLILSEPRKTCYAWVFLPNPFHLNPLRVKRFLRWRSRITVSSADMGAYPLASEFNGLYIRIPPLRRKNPRHRRSAENQTLKLLQPDRARSFVLSTVTTSFNSLTIRNPPE